VCQPAGAATTHPGAAQSAGGTAGRLQDAGPLAAALRDPRRRTARRLLDDIQRFTGFGEFPERSQSLSRTVALHVQQVALLNVGLRLTIDEPGPGEPRTRYGWCDERRRAYRLIRPLSSSHLFESRSSGSISVTEICHSQPPSSNRPPFHPQSYMNIRSSTLEFNGTENNVTVGLSSPATCAGRTTCPASS
jgi:hypothetical protein